MKKEMPKTKTLLIPNPYFHAIDVEVTFVTPYIYILIAIALDESIFLDVLHFSMKNIKSRDLEATPMGGEISKPIQ